MKKLVIGSRFIEKEGFQSLFIRRVGILSEKISSMEENESK